jgi:hypothetical protein
MQLIVIIGLLIDAVGKRPQPVSLLKKREILYKQLH